MNAQHFFNALLRGARDDALADARRKRDQCRRYTAALLVKIAHAYHHELMLRTTQQD